MPTAFTLCRLVPWCFLPKALRIDSIAVWRKGQDRYRAAEGDYADAQTGAPYTLPDVTANNGACYSSVKAALGDGKQAAARTGLNWPGRQVPKYDFRVSPR